MNQTTPNLKKGKTMSEDEVTQIDTNVTAKRIKSFVERIERQEEEKAAISEDIKETFAEAKSIGFDVKTLRKIIRLRKMDKDKRIEEEELLELYKSAVGLD